MSESERKDFEKEYKDLLLSELLIALMKQDMISVRQLAGAVGISPTIVQGIRSESRKNVSMRSFLKILRGLGCKLVIEKDKHRFAIDLTRETTKL